MKGSSSRLDCPSSAVQQGYFLWKKMPSLALRASKDKNFSPLRSGFPNVHRRSDYSSVGGSKR